MECGRAFPLGAAQRVWPAYLLALALQLFSSQVSAPGGIIWQDGCQAWPANMPLSCSQVAVYALLNANCTTPTGGTVDPVSRTYDYAIGAVNSGDPSDLPATQE